MQFEDMFSAHNKRIRRIEGDNLCWYVRRNSGKSIEVVMCFPLDMLDLLDWKEGDLLRFVVGKQDSEQFMCVVKSDQGLSLSKAGGKLGQSIRYLKISKKITTEEAVKFFGCDLSKRNELVYPKDGWPHVGDDGVLIFASKKLPKVVTDERSSRVPVLRRR